MKRGRDNVDMGNCLMLLAKVGEGSRERVSKGGDFKCKTCNRQFHSFQALGGHRASHKKLKFMASNLKSCSTVTPKMHQCPICGLEFEIGQALGGHMRKHKGTKRIRLCLDLNLTPYENDQNLDLRTPVLNLFN